MKNLITLDCAQGTNIPDTISNRISLKVDNQHRKMTCVNEAGVNLLVMQSRKKEAIPYKWWIASEVLPSIRKTGRYEYPYTVNPKDTLTKAQADTLCNILDNQQKLSDTEETTTLFSGQPHPKASRFFYAYFKGGLREPNKTPKGNKFRRLNTVVEARHHSQKILDKPQNLSDTEALSKSISGFRTRQQCGFFTPESQVNALYGGTTAGEYNTFGEYPAAVSYRTESESCRPSKIIAASLEIYKEAAMNSQIINANFNGISISFNNAAYLNATAIAAHFEKRVQHYLGTEDTQNYINALATHLSKAVFTAFDKKQLVIVKRGSPENGGGTWLHPKLAVHFARWLDAEFAVWCDEQIEKIIYGKTIPYTVNPADTLTLEQGDTLRNMLKDTVVKLPKDKQASFMVKGWSKLRSHFKVGYRQIPQSEYPEALSIVSRHIVEALEGELLPPVEEVPAHIVMMPIDTRKNTRFEIIVKNGLVGRYFPRYASDSDDFNKPWGTLLKAQWEEQ